MKNVNIGGSVLLSTRTGAISEAGSGHWPWTEGGILSYFKDNIWSIDPNPKIVAHGK